jgi:dihydrofolate reductase
MRTLKVFESISLDGYFTDAHGDMRFAHAVAPDAEFNAWVSGNASSGGALLFGRKTYEMMASFWTSPAAAQQLPQVAAGMNAAPKYLASRTVTPTWNNTTRLEGDLATAVRALKAQAGPPIVILGSGSVAATLGEAGLVDAYQFVVIPVALGAGRTVFSAHTRLRLVEQRAFKNGNVVLSYEV